MTMLRVSDFAFLVLFARQQFAPAIETMSMVWGDCSCSYAFNFGYEANVPADLAACAAKCIEPPVDGLYTAAVEIKRHFERKKMR